MAGTNRMTDRARRVMALAEREARRRGSVAVEPEHVLLGLALEKGGVAAHTLRGLGASAEQIVRELPATLPDPSAGPAPLPWATGTERVVAQAHAEMVPLGHNYVGTEHLVLAIVQAEAAAAALARLGVTADVVRREVYAILGHELAG